jgi:hypothetical protein
MKEQALEIRDKVSNGEIDTNEAFWQLLDLLVISGRFYTDKEIERIKYEAFCKGVNTDW